jgi:hypothetical protein
MLFHLLVTLMLANLVQEDVPFEIGLSPGEGRPVIQSVTTELELREQPSASAKAVRRLAVTPGQRLHFDETRYRTIAPGRLEAVIDTTVTGRRVGAIRALSRADYYSRKFPHGSVKLNAGAVVDYLQYRAEGTCFVRIDGVVIDAETCPRHNRDAFRLVAEPVIEWWVRLVSDDTPIGWLLLTDKTAKVVDREW